MKKSFSLFIIIFITTALNSQNIWALDIDLPSEGKELSMVEAFKKGREALKQGDFEEASTALEYAAQKGHLLSRWKLGKMYASGSGVAQDHMRAFQYFTGIADEYAEIEPTARYASIVSDSFYESGRYYIYGIPNSQLRPHTEKGMTLLIHASSYFGNDDAQFLLGKIYTEGHDQMPRNLQMAMRWLKMSCRNQNAHAQLYLGELLLTDPKFKRHRKEGALWVEMASRILGVDNPDVMRLLTISEIQMNEISHNKQ